MKMGRGFVNNLLEQFRLIVNDLGCSERLVDGSDYGEMIRLGCLVITRRDRCLVALCVAPVQLHQ